MSYVSACEKVIPLHNYVLVEMWTPERTPGGIVIPDGAQSDVPYTGTVMAVGPGGFASSGERIPVAVEKGQKVAIHPAAMQSAVTRNIAGVKYGLFRDIDVVCVVETDRVH